MANTVAGVLITGLLSARPAANTVSAGALYSASDTGLIYQSNGSSWATWATLGTSGAIVNPMTTAGDIIYATGGGTPARQGIGGSNTVLHGGSIPPAYTAVVETDFSFTDITTANASTSKHGLLPRLNGSNTWYLRGDGTYGQVLDSDLSTSDITTNNVATTKHGFAPKLPNDATKYLDGTGAYSVPAGSGSSPLTTKGDLFGYDTGNARIPIGTDTYVLTADSAQALGLKWAAAGGGGSLEAGELARLNKTIISGTYGDHFDGGGALDGKWSYYVGSGISLADLSGWAHGNGSHTGIIQAIPGGNWTIECEVMTGGDTAGAYEDNGLIITSGSAIGSSTDMRFGVGMQNSLRQLRIVWEKFVNGTFSSAYVTDWGFGAPFFPVVYLRLVWNGTTVAPWWCFDRFSWLPFEAAHAPGFTPAYFGLHSDPGRAYFNYFDKVA